MLPSPNLKIINIFPILFHIYPVNICKLMVRSRGWKNISDGDAVNFLRNPFIRHIMTCVTEVNIVHGFSIYQSDQFIVEFPINLMTLPKSKQSYKKATVKAKATP